MGFDLTNQKVSFTYGGLVQHASGNFYDGYGNSISMGDVSALSPILVNYINDSSLNQSTFKWIGGYLEPSVAAGGDVTKEYVDGSLFKYVANSSLAVESFYYDSSGYLHAAGTTGLDLVGKWKYTTGTGDTNPGNGYFAMSDPNPMSAGMVYVNRYTSPGVDSKFILMQLKYGDYFYVQKSVDSNEYATFLIIGDAVDATSYVKLSVTGINGSGSFTNNKEFSAMFLFTGRSQFALQSYVDASLNKIRAEYIPDISLNHSQFIWNNGVIDISVIGAGGVSQQYVDGSLSARDASIQSLFDDKIQIANIKATYIPDASLDHSKFVWNNGILDVSVIGGSGVSQSYVDSSLTARDASISYLLVNQTADETALSILTSRHNFTETSVGTLTSRHNFTETSVGTLTSRHNFSETSLGTLTSRHNFTETSLGTLTSKYNFTESSLRTLTSRHNVTESSLGILTTAYETSINWLNANKVEGTGVWNQVALWNGTKVLSGDTALTYDSSGNHMVIGYTGTDPSATLVVDSGIATHNTVGRFRGNYDSFIQIEAKNINTGPLASADFVASADNATEDLNYIDLGINNTTYTFGGPFGNMYPLDGYLVLNTDPSAIPGNLLIGNGTAGKDVVMFTGPDLNAYDNEKLRITSDGSILIGQPTSKKYKLEVNGDINIPSGYHYLRNGVTLDDTYTTYEYVDGSFNKRDASISYLFTNKVSKSDLDSSLSRYLPYVGATQDLSLGTHSIKSVEAIVFNQNPSVTRQEGQLFYDAPNKTLGLHTGGDVTLQIGQETVIIAYNNTGTTIKNGKIVYVVDSCAGLPSVALAKADNILTASAIGMTTQDILPGTTGFVTSAGIVHDISTGNYTPNTVLYLSDSSAGEITSTPVLSPSIWLKIGRVIQSSHSAGSVFVSIQQERSITSLYDVGIVNPSQDDILKWNGIKWINATGSTISAGAGVTYFLSGIDSNLPGYESAWKTPVDVSLLIDYRVVNSSSGLAVIDTYASEPSTGLGTSLIDAGIWEFNTFACVGNSLTAYSEILTYVYKRDYFGVETSLFNVTTGDINSELVTLYTETTVQPAFVVNPSDRLLFRYVARTDSSIDVSINLHHGGSNYYSHIHTPLATRHNDLAGLQGGLADQYYHLNAAQLTVVNNTSGVNTGNQDLTPYALITNVNSSLNAIYVYTQRYLKEASLGTGFTWNNGYLDASGGGGTGDVTKAYVDGSLAKRDASLYDLRVYTDGSLNLKANTTYVDTYNNIQDTSIGQKTSKLYVDGSFNKRDLSIGELYGLLYSTVSVSYIDGSLAARDACMGNIRATYIPDVSLGDAFIWAGGVLNTQADPTVDYSSSKPFTGHVSVGYENNLATSVISETSLGIKTVNITYNSNNDVSVVYINNYGTVNRQITFKRDVYRNITELIIT